MDALVKFYSFINKLELFLISFRRNKTLSSDIGKELQKILKEMHAREDVQQTTQDC
jgi:hypothetical protein